MEEQKKRFTGKWISVKDELPNIGDYVIVCASGEIKKNITYKNAVVMAFVGQKGFIDVELDEVLDGVTHWMELPDVPECCQEKTESEA